MKRGQTVYVCQDGKLSRAAKGVVLETKKGLKVLVEFPEYYDGEVIRHWFRHDKRLPKREGVFGGYVPVNFSVLMSFFGRPGDYYRVYSANKFKRFYKVD